MAPKQRPPVKTPRWLLRRADQAVVAAAVATAILSIAAWWLAQGGWGKRLIELDQLPPQTARFTVDINAAEWAELTLLPGVGEELARRIVESREREGAFADFEQLRRVRGIGPRTLERITPYLRPIAETGDVAGR